MEKGIFKKTTGRLIDNELEELYTQDMWLRVQQQLKIVFGCALVMVAATMLVNMMDERLAHALDTLLLLRTFQFISMLILIWLLRCANHFSVTVSIAILVVEFATMVVEMADYFIGYLPFESTLESLDMPFMVLMIFIIYALVPNRSYMNIGICLISTTIFMTILLLTDNVTIGSATYLIMMFIFVNGVGIGYEAYINRFYRVDFLRRLELEREICERQRVQSELTNAKDKLEEINISRSRFLAAASHDLRQPLHALGLFLDSIKIQDQANLKVLQKILDAKDSLDLLLDSILDISRLESGDIVIHKRAIAVGVLFKQLQGEYLLISKSRDIELSVVDTSVVVFSDLLLLGRILRNFLENAFKYTHTGRITLGVRRRDGQASLEVWDTGIGINKADQVEVFKEFHQVGNPERDRRKGLGLGLAIVQRIAELLDHPLDLQSIIGKGSCFSISVETTDQIPNTKTESSNLPHSLTGMHILVIDDEETIREATGMLLRDWQCQVMLCADGDSAAQLIECTSLVPDLIISDYRLRDGKTGVETAKSLLREFDMDCPVLLITGETDSASISNAASSGFQLFHKPLKPAKLRLFLNELALNNRKERQIHH